MKSLEHNQYSLSVGVNIFFLVNPSVRFLASLKNLPEMEKTWAWSLGQEDPWRRKWQPTPILTGKSHGQRSLGLQSLGSLSPTLWLTLILQWDLVGSYWVIGDTIQQLHSYVFTQVIWKLCLYENLQVNIYNNYIHNGQNLEATRMSFIK